MQYSQLPNVKPGKIQAIAIISLINGILNIISGLGVSAAVVISTMFIGILCVPVTILPSVLGIFEIIYATKLLANPPVPVKPSQTLAIMEICCIIFGNVVSLAAGIVALVFYSDPEVKAYFASLNPTQFPQQ
jgi:hypothetical protein